MFRRADIPTTRRDPPEDGAPAARHRRFVVPLKPTVLIAFAAITVPVLLAIVQINYRASHEVARAHAEELVERFRKDAMEDIVAEFAAVRLLVDPAAELGRQEPQVFAGDSVLGYLMRLLAQSDTALSVYVGREDGSFRQARRITDPTLAIHGQLPSAGTSYAYRVVDPARGSPVLDRYVFLDAEGRELGEAAAETGYDPRRRPWYGQAVAAGGTMITDPEIFWAFGLVGFTIAAPYAAGGKAEGVVAADITLDGFSDYLARSPISPGSVSYLLDGEGRVLAASDRVATFGSNNAAINLPHVTDVANRAVSLAFSVRPRTGADYVYPVEFDGRDYIASLSHFGADFGKPWRLLVVTPLDDFTDEFNRKDQRMLMLGLAAVVVQLAAVYVIASLLSRPLQRLARKVDRIQALDTRREPLPPVRSRIREVAVLGHAIETLDMAVQTFARFVPVGLVRQLLNSEQKLELGGQSRFLTIFFSDVEGFSTIAERIASRDLLARISTLLELASKSVHDENGTIDKFVGDGVMAFWGAPAQLDDHAWHACVAALRIQRALDALNAEWRRADEPEMRLRVGIHSDAVLVGNVGSRERMSYTVLGDGVNIAARLEGLNKIYGTLTLISHDTFREAGDRLCVRPVDEVAVKGRRSRITVYELLGAYGAGSELEPSAAAKDLARATQVAFDALVDGDQAAALARFRQVLAAHPDDPVARLHVERLGGEARAVLVRAGAAGEP